MATKKKSTDQPLHKAAVPNAEIKNAGLVVEERITDTLEKNYMPYAMSVIVSRAIPEIDGFKPSHRKLLYTMYKMNLLSGARTKSANVVGQTMRLNPHGEAAIYETMVRLSRGYEALLHPFVDSKGNFGKSYSRDMAYAASRYTEVKLDSVCAELFRDIDKDTVDFVDNYDSTMQEPLLLPCTFPTVLVNANMGIAVGMASSICPFNLSEVCDTAIAVLKKPGHDVFQTLSAPDFPTGGSIIYDAEALRTIYETGRGSVKVRARYVYDKAANCIEITEIPPTTTIEAIIDKIVDLVKGGKIREISDIRDETDLSGLKIAIDLKRGTDPDKLISRLFRMTPLQDTFSANFNILVGGTPRVMGVSEILKEWTAFRSECIRRRVFYELTKKKEKLHLLSGLKKILLDIDKAIAIIRQTEEEAEVVPNLMIGFLIDEVQAEFIAEIRLRNLNREYLLKRTEEMENLLKEVAEMEAILQNKDRITRIIIDELGEVKKKYGKPRRSLLIYPEEEQEMEEEEEIPDYPVTFFFTREGYFKKITPQSLRMSGEQKLKEGDEVIMTLESSNNAELLFFSDRQQVYKAKAVDFSDTKASVMGDFIPAKLEFEPGESAAYLAVTKDYGGVMLFAFENGKVAKVEMSAYATKTNRKKLLKAYSDKSPLCRAFYAKEDGEFLLTSSAGRVLLFHSGTIASKSTKDTQGVAVMQMKKGQRLMNFALYQEGELKNPNRYRVKSLPSTGSLVREDDRSTQLTLE